MHRDTEYTFDTINKLYPHDALFVVERNQNTNTVVYRANLRSNGSVDPARPVVAEWVMFEKSRDGSVRDELTTMEQKLAFGFKLTPLGNGQYNMLVHALPSKPLRLFFDPHGRMRVGVQMASGPAILHRIFIHVNKSKRLSIPSVEKAVAYGVSMSGKPVRQVLMKNDI